MNKLSPHALGVAFAVLWAAYIGCCGITAIFGWGANLVHVFASLYIGYSASVIGALIGVAWALLDGYIAGFVIAFLYNAVVKNTAS